MRSFSDGLWRGPAPPVARAVCHACLRKRHAPSHASAVWGAAQSAKHLQSPSADWRALGSGGGAPPDRACVSHSQSPRLLLHNKTKRRQNLTKPCNEGCKRDPYLYVLQLRSLEYCVNTGSATLMNLLTNLLFFMFIMTRTIFLFNSLRIGQEP